MRHLLRISGLIDALTAVAGRLANVLILLSCVVSATNAMMRYGFDVSDNWPLELQWYFFGAAVMLGSAYTLQRNEHVRVDLLYGHISDRARAWVDLCGTLFFLLPICAFFSWLSWKTLFVPSYNILEQSPNAGGLPRYPIKLLLPLGFALLLLQGLSETVKRLAALNGAAAQQTAYERPLQ